MQSSDVYTAVYTCEIGQICTSSKHIMPLSIWEQCRAAADMYAVSHLALCGAFLFPFKQKIARAINKQTLYLLEIWQQQWWTAKKNNNNNQYLLFDIGTWILKSQTKNAWILIFGFVLHQQCIRQTWFKTNIEIAWERNKWTKLKLVAR